MADNGLALRPTASRLALATSLRVAVLAKGLCSGHPASPLGKSTGG